MLLVPLTNKRWHGACFHWGAVIVAALGGRPEARLCSECRLLKCFCKQVGGVYKDDVLNMYICVCVCPPMSDQRLVDS